MSFDEIKTLFYKMEGKVSNETEMKKGINAVDTNKDGFIDMGEFMAFNYQTGKSEYANTAPTDPS
jgi:Ca2+-binding EF-hand superfamily protein